MKVMIISGSRADAGALGTVEEALNRVGVLTGWFDIPAPAVRQDSRLSVASAAALACSATAKHLYENKPDLVLLHGDRYEVLGAATGAFLMGLPLAHLGGGDITQGSQDDSIRHSITKLCHLHFATCEDSARRIVNLGESPDRVFNVGDPGIDALVEGLPSLNDGLKAVGMPDAYTKYFLVGYHPNTFGGTKEEVNTLLSSLQTVLAENKSVGAILLDPNKDADYLFVEQEFRKFAAQETRVRYSAQLPRMVYLGLLKHCLVLVGNSSAAYYEAPTLGTPVITFGYRQVGRKPSSNFLAQCSDGAALVKALQYALRAPRPGSVLNPYGDGHAAQRIAEVITHTKPSNLLQKQFYNIPCEDECLTKFGSRSTLNGNGGDTPKRSLYDGLHATTSQWKNEQPYDSLILAAAQAPAPGFWPEKDSQ